MANTLWKRPVLRTDEEQHVERRVSWLELFYDLVFVVTISQLSHTLATHMNAAGIAQFALLFMPIWWMWVSGTVYNERFETEDISYRLLVFVQMVAVATLAVFVHGAFSSLANGFALTYAVARGIVVFMWYRGGRHNPVARPVTDRYVAGFSLSILLWASSVFFPQFRYAMWGLGLVADLATPLFTIRHQSRLPRYSSGKLPERVGLFVIIALGEAVVSVITSVAQSENLSLEMGFTALLGFALSFMIWWVYFDFVSRRAPKPTVVSNISWTHLHLPLLMSIVAASAASLNLIAGDGAAHGAEAHAAEVPGAVARWVLGGAVAVTLTSIALLQLVLREKPGEPINVRSSVRVKLTMAAVAIAFTAVSAGVSTTWLYAGLLASFLVVVVYGVGVWLTWAQPSADDDVQISGVG